MRFQTSETVQVSDPEMVLRVLETCLQNISPEVVRYGDEITLHGLGPSPRSINPHDKTVLRVTAKRDQTVIDADVSFQASAMLGEMPQDEVVRSKLNQVFLQMRSQLDSDALRASAPDATSSASPAPIDVGPVETGNVRRENLASIAAHETPIELVPERRVESNVDSILGAEQISLFHKEEYRKDDDVETGSRGRVGWWMTGLIALLLIVGGGYLYFWHRSEVRTFFHRLATPPTIVAAPEPPSDDRVAPTGDDEVHVAPHPHAQASVSAKVVDPKIWLQDWASAMRTKDPAAQAAFYANRVDSYLGKHNVSRDTVLRDRKATIRMRKGVWTMKMENVVVLRQTDSEAVVRLIKHFIDEPVPSEVLEWFVPSELVLKRTNEGWKISSEKDLGSSSPAAGDLRSLKRSGK